MRYLILLLLVWSPLVAGTSFHDCVGDHHEGCPVLVTKEQKTSDPGCQGRHEISHSTASFLIKGTVVLDSASGRLPARQLTVIRECLSEKGKIIRGCPMPFPVTEAGHFELEVWWKSVSEEICRDDVVVAREYDEHVQLRFQVTGCKDLVVPLVWPWDETTLVIDCQTTK